MLQLIFHAKNKVRKSPKSLPINYSNLSYLNYQLKKESKKLTG